MNLYDLSTQNKKKKPKLISEGTTTKHRIGLTVTDPNHPMVSKRDEPIQKTVRVPGDDAAKAINAAIAHYRRKGYKVHDHHYMGTVDYTVNEFAVDGGREGGGRNNGQWYTDGEIGDRVGDAWFEEFDISNDMFNIDAHGEKAKQALVSYANQWLDDKGYNVNVVGAETNEEDHDLKWYIVGSLDEPQVDEALTMKHQRDHDTQRRPDISNSLADRGFDMSEKPNVAKSADGHPTVKWRHHGHAGHTRVEPTLKPTTVDRKDARPIPSFLKKGVAEDRLDELSPKTLGSYINKATKDAGTLGYGLGDINARPGKYKDSPDVVKDVKHSFNNRIKGVEKASHRLTKEQGVAEGHADQQRKIFKKNGHPVGEVGIDRESSPGNGQWYMKYYATGDDFVGYDSMEEAVADLKHLVNQFKAEGVAEGSGYTVDDEIQHWKDMALHWARMGDEKSMLKCKANLKAAEQKKKQGVAEGSYDDDKGITHTRGSLVAKLEALPKGSDDFEWNRIQAIHHLKQGNMLRAKYYMALMKRGEQGVAEDTDKYAELSKKIQDLAQAGKEGEANKLRYELNRLLMLDRDKKRRQERGVAEGSEEYCDACDRVITKKPHVCPGSQGVAEGGYRQGFADPNAPSLGGSRRKDDEGNSEFDDRQRRQTGMIFYKVDDAETARAIGLQQTRTGKWYLRTGNRHAQQTADRAFGIGRIWYPESVEEAGVFGFMAPEQQKSTVKKPKLTLSQIRDLSKQEDEKTARYVRSNDLPRNPDHMRVVHDDVELGELSNELLDRYKKELGVRATAADRAGDYDQGHEYFKKINRATIRQGENDARRHAEKENDMMETRLNMMRKAGYDL